jgi:uncharacterized MAPEG superfamily protein
MPAFVCVLISGLMPIVWAGCTKFLGRFSLKDNSNPRQFLEHVQGKAQRAHWAQLNSWEAFAPFAAAVIIAHIMGASADRLNLYAMVFVGARILHGIFYIADKPTLRSLVWTVGLVANIGIYYLAFTVRPS